MQKINLRDLTPEKIRDLTPETSRPWMLFLLALVFIAPFILGSSVYFFRDAFSFNSNAKGQVLSPYLAKEVLSSSLENALDHFLGKWQLLYFSPRECDALCQTQFQLLQNVRLALGKDQSRVVLHHMYLKEHVKDHVKDPMSLKETRLLNKASQPVALSEGSLLIIDPKGWLVTHYSASTFQAKNVLDDLRRLMRYSYAG